MGNEQSTPSQPSEVSSNNNCATQGDVKQVVDQAFAAHEEREHAESDCKQALEAERELRRKLEEQIEADRQKEAAAREAED